MLARVEVEPEPEPEPEQLGVGERWYPGRTSGVYDGRTSMRKVNALGNGSECCKGGRKLHSCSKEGRFILPGGRPSKYRESIDKHTSQKREWRCVGQTPATMGVFANDVDSLGKTPMRAAKINTGKGG